MAKRKRCKHERITLETGNMLGSPLCQVKCLDCGKRFGTAATESGARQMYQSQLADTKHDLSWEQGQ